MENWPVRSKVGRRQLMQTFWSTTRMHFSTNRCVYAKQHFLQTSSLLKSLHQPVLHKHTTCSVAAWRTRAHTLRATPVGAPRASASRLRKLRTHSLQVRDWPDLQSTSRSNCSLGIGDNIWEGLIFHQKDWECLKSAARSGFTMCNLAGKSSTASSHRGWQPILRLSESLAFRPSVPTTASLLYHF